MFRFGIPSDSDLALSTLFAFFIDVSEEKTASMAKSKRRNGLGKSNK